MTDSRGSRLHERFKLIQQVLTEKYSEDKAFLAASAAWLQAIQYTCKQLMRKAQAEKDFKISLGEKELQILLMSFHKEMCEFLEQDEEEIIKLAGAFHEVLHDICHEGG